MESYQRQNPALSFAYVDYRLAKRTVTEASAQNLILNIGGAGRICNKVFQMVEKNTDLGDTSILGNFTSTGPNASLLLEDTSSVNGSLIYNLRYNDNFLFPVDVDNSARHFHNLLRIVNVISNKLRFSLNNFCREVLSRCFINANTLFNSRWSPE